MYIHLYGVYVFILHFKMSIVVSETSPRALLDSALQLSYTLNLLGEEESASQRPAPARGPGFILHEVESVMLKVRADLDCAYVAKELGDGDKDKLPLMMRLRDHIDAVSSILTGNSVRFATVDSTTLHELIDSLAGLNASVSCSKESICTIQ